VIDSPSDVAALQNYSVAGSEMIFENGKRGKIVPTSAISFLFSELAVRFDNYCNREENRGSHYCIHCHDSRGVMMNSSNRVSARERSSLRRLEDLSA
jgi:hypothetical protein